ncbi:MAG: HAD family phosphatase [Candidatus Spechtbacterales bacterium]
MKKNPTIKAIIFDIGGVILTRWNNDSLHDYAIGLFSVEKEKYMQAFNAEIDTLQAGEITDIEFWKRVCKALNIEPPADEVLDDIFPGVYKRTVRTDKKMVELIKGLRAPGKYKLGIISNTIDDHVKVFKNFGFLEHFDEVILSNEVDLYKPRPEIYKLALEKLEVKAEESVFIDDLQPNIDGAEAVGMDAVLFRGIEDLKREFKKLGIK